MSISCAGLLQLAFSAILRLSGRWPYNAPLVGDCVSLVNRLLRLHNLCVAQMPVYLVNSASNREDPWLLEFVQQLSMSVPQRLTLANARLYISPSGCFRHSTRPPILL